MADTSTELDRAELMIAVAVAREKILRAALMLAAERYNDDPADPGWSLDLYEDQMDAGITEYLAAKKARDAAESRHV